MHVLWCLFSTLISGQNQDYGNGEVFCISASKYTIYVVVNIEDVYNSVTPQTLCMSYGAYSKSVPCSTTIVPNKFGVLCIAHMIQVTKTKLF